MIIYARNIKDCKLVLYYFLTVFTRTLYIYCLCPIVQMENII